MKYLTQEQLDPIITNHKLWLDTNGYRGERANFSNVNLSNADFRNENLRNADFSYANFSYADFSNADFSYANLRNANLSNADFRNAILSYANFRNTNFSNASLSYANFSNAKNIIPFQKLGGRTCYAVLHPTCLMIKAGCFWGTLNEFEIKCKETHPNDALKAYEPQIEMLKQIESKLL